MATEIGEDIIRDGTPTYYSPRGGQSTTAGSSNRSDGWTAGGGCMAAGRTWWWSSALVRGGACPWFRARCKSCRARVCGPRTYHRLTVKPTARAEVQRQAARRAWPALAMAAHKPPVDTVSSPVRHRSVTPCRHLPAYVRPWCTNSSHISSALFLSSTKRGQSICMHDTLSHR
jgi:hypothetical protein